MAARNLRLHAFVNRSVRGGKDHGDGAVAIKLVLMLTLAVIGAHCHSSCVAALGISMPEVLPDPGNLALLQRAGVQEVFEIADEVLIRLELLRWDHPSLADSCSKSNSAPPESLSERIVEEVKRSNARRDAIARSMEAAHGSFTSSKPYSIPVSSDSGAYLTQIALGTPKQNITAILDTGSDLVWTQCLPCVECLPQIGPIFNPAKSSTYRPVRCGANNLCQDLPIIGCPAAGCEYVYGYLGGSGTTGNFAKDTVTLGNASVPHLGFGCGHNNTGFLANADGIVAFGQGPLSLISQLSSAGVVSKKFSYCLVSYSSYATSPLIFGDAAVTSAPPGVAYTPLQANPYAPSLYYLDLVAISVAGKAVNYPAGTFALDTSSGNGGVILDVGTTFTYLETAGFDAVVAAVEANLTYPRVSGAPYGLDFCFDVEGATTNSLKLPEMVFHFKNEADFVLTIEDLYLIVNNTGPIICLAMISNSGFSIFGNFQQQDHLIIYDVVQFQIGFKSINCG